LTDQGHPTRSLPTRALQPILQLAVLEVFQVQRRGVFHQAQAGDVAELLGKQRIEQRDCPSQNVRRNREGELQKQQSADAIDEAGCIPLRVCPCRARHPVQYNHLVDDQLADVERDDGQSAPGQAKHAFADGQQRGLSARRAG
jgi:hypothetical protein